MEIKNSYLILDPDNGSDWEFMKLIPKLTKDIDKFKEKNISDVIWSEEDHCYMIPIDAVVNCNPDDFTAEDWDQLRDFQDNLSELLNDDTRRNIAIEYMESSLRYDDIKDNTELQDMVLSNMKLTEYKSVPEIFDQIEKETDGKGFTELLNRFDKDQLLRDAGYTKSDILAYLKKEGQVLDVIKEYISSQDLMRFLSDIKISIGNAFQYIWNQFKKKFNELGKD